MKADRPGPRRRPQVVGTFGLSFVSSSNTPVREHPAGRVCAWEGCDTELAQANPDDLCYLHERMAGRMRAFRPPKGKKYKKKTTKKAVGL